MSALKKTKEMVVTMVFPANVMNLWDEAVPLLKPALDVMGTHDLEDVRKALLAGKAHLWVGWKDQVEWLIVTEFVDYPRGPWLRLWLAGAQPKLKADWGSAEEAIIDFAVKNKCIGIEQIGREGWSRRYGDFTNASKGLRVFRHQFDLGS